MRQHAAGDSSRPTWVSAIDLLIVVLLAGILAACGGQTAGAPTGTAPGEAGSGSAGTAATSGQASTQGPINVLAAETFLADIAQNVAGDRLKVESLLPIGLDPHAFEPTPADLTVVASSDVLIISGAGFEEFLDELLENAGGERQVIEASAGLASREIREGEVASNEAVDLSTEICETAGAGHPQQVVAGQADRSPGTLPAEQGLFEVALTQQADGSYAGYLTFATDEAGDFQIATGPGQLRVLNADGSSEREIETTLALDCDGLAQGNIVELEKGGRYLLALNGFSGATVPLFIDPLGEHGHAHASGDPHFWLDPTKVVTYVENIRDGLSEADPANAAQYAANAEAYIAQLKQLDQEIAAQVAQIPAERRLLVTDHDSFGYFADRYGFKLVGAIIPSATTDTAPSAQQLVQLIERIRASGAKAIFLEAGTNPQMAQQVAEETGVRVVTDLYSHSTTEPGGPAPTYIEMMRYNSKAIVEALK